MATPAATTSPTRGLRAGVLLLALAAPPLFAFADCPPAASEPSAERIRAGQQNARDHGFLWRIGKGGRTSYLYGTLHIAKVEWMFPGPRVAQALRESDTVALELDLLDAEVTVRMINAVSTWQGPALPDALQQRLARQFEAACLPAEALAALPPELQIDQLGTLSARRDGIDPAYGIDRFLAGYARREKKAVVSLETPELQAEALRLPDPRDAQALVENGLAELEADRVRPMVLRIARVWAESDVGALDHYNDWCECRGSAAERDLMKRLLDDRNPAFAERIAALHEGGQRVFAAVGSLHMVGPGGLPALLARRGYRVERVELRR